MYFPPAFFITIRIRIFYHHQFITMSTITKRDQIQWDLADIRTAGLAIRAINHTLRRRIMDTLHQYGRPMSVTDIYITMRMDQSACSQQLAVLRKAGLVDDEQEGKFIFYTVNYEMVGRVQETMKLFAR